MEKKCTLCSETKKLDDFRIDKKRSDGRGSWCKKCVSLIASEWNKTHKEKVRESSKKYYKKTHISKPRKAREKYGITPKEKYEYNKKLFFEMYGNACECCGEMRITFLALDHINGQAGKKKDSAAQAYAKAIKKHNPNEYRILCHNCNHAVRLGICPHQIKDLS